MVLVVPEQSQRPYRFGMTLLCVGALFNWLGLADTYSDPVPAIRYIGVGLIAAGASLICMAMCFWMRNIHDPSSNSDYDMPSDPIHVISSDQCLEKPPEYSTVVDVPPCYEDAIKLGATPIVLRLKQALTSPSAHLKNSNVETNGAECDHSLSFPSDQQPDSSREWRSSPATAVAVKQNMAKSTAAASGPCQNSSQNETSLAKVLRRSMQGIPPIRRLKSASEDGGTSYSLQQSSSVESGCATVQEINYAESAKVDR